jgi:hypothetical protein
MPDSVDSGRAERHRDDIREITLPGAAFETGVRTTDLELPGAIWDSARRHGRTAAGDIRDMGRP